MIKQYNLYDELMKVIRDNNKRVVNIEYVSISFDEITTRYVKFDLFAKVANKMREREEWCAPYVNPSLKVVFDDGSWIERVTDWDEYEKWTYHDCMQKPENELWDEKELEYQIFKYGTAQDVNLKIMDAVIKRRTDDDEEEEDKFRNKVMTELCESNPLYKRVIEDNSLKEFFN
jgi:hypothetical protein